MPFSSRLPISLTLRSSSAKPRTSHAPQPHINITLTPAQGTFKTTNPHDTFPSNFSVMELLHHAASLYHSITHIHHTLGDAHDEMASSSFQRATETVEYLQLRLPERLARPRVAIVCGSGLGGLANAVNEGVREEWEYKDVPNFPLSTGKSWRQRSPTDYHGNVITLETETKM